jgi:hypothetical protein
MYLINLRGTNYQLPIQEELEPGNYKAILQKENNNDNVTLIIKKESNDSATKSDINNIQKTKVSVKTTVQENLEYLDKIKIVKPLLQNKNSKLNNILYETKSSSNSLKKTNSNQNELKMKLTFLENFQKGDEINIKILKPLMNKNTFLVKSGQFEFEIKIEPPPKEGMKEFVGKIIKTFPNPSVKIIDEENPIDNKISSKINQNIEGKTTQIIKKNLFDLNKKSLIENIKNSPKLTLNEFTPAAIEKVVKESGNFFENKLLNNFSITDDLKFDAIKTDNIQLKDSIIKLQLFNSILNNGILSFFNFEDNGLKSGEMQIKKNNNSFSVHIKMDFSQIGETFIKITSNNHKTDIVVSSEKDISDKIAEISFPGINIHWKALNKQDIEEFNIEKKIMEHLGGLNILI